MIKNIVSEQIGRIIKLFPHFRTIKTKWDCVDTNISLICFV